MRWTLLTLLLLCLMMPLHAQDNPTGYDIALQRIAEAAANGATELDLSWLELSNVPREIGHLTNLQILSLEGNQLTNLPSEIWQLTNLQELNCFRNQLTSLAPTIAQLTNLRELDLTGNQLSSLPSEIGGLTNLQILYLSIPSPK